MIGRRGFLQQSGVLAAAAAGQLCVSGGFAQEPIPRPGGPRLKISLNAFSFNAALSSGEVTLFDLLEFCAENDFDALDPTGYYFPGYPEVPSDSYVNEFKRRAFELGLDISGTGVRNNFCEPDAAKRKADIELIKQWVVCAAKLGAPMLRIFAGKGVAEGYTWEQTVSWMADDIRECVQFAAQHGIMLGIQNHAEFLLTAEHVLDVLRRVDSEWFGVVLDTGSFRSSDPYADIARIVPYAISFQIKELLLGKESGVRMDLPKLMGIIKAGGYRGYIPIETLARSGAAYDPRHEVVRLLGEVRQALG